MKSLTATIRIDGLIQSITIDPTTTTLSAIIYLAQFNQLLITNFNRS